MLYISIKIVLFFENKASSRQNAFQRPRSDSTFRSISFANPSPSSGTFHRRLQPMSIETVPSSPRRNPAICTYSFCHHRARLNRSVSITREKNDRSVDITPRTYSPIDDLIRDPHRLLHWIIDASRHETDPLGLDPGYDPSRHRQFLRHVHSHDFAQCDRYSHVWNQTPPRFHNR